MLRDEQLLEIARAAGAREEGIGQGGAYRDLVLRADVTPPASGPHYLRSLREFASAVIAAAVGATDRERVAQLEHRVAEQESAIDLLLRAAGAVAALKGGETPLESAIAAVQELQRSRRQLSCWREHRSLVAALDSARDWLSAQIAAAGLEASPDRIFEWRTTGPDAPKGCAGGALVLFDGSQPVAGVTIIERADSVFALRWKDSS